MKSFESFKPTKEEIEFYRKTPLTLEIVRKHYKQYDNLSDEELEEIINTIKQFVGMMYESGIGKIEEENSK